MASVWKRSRPGSRAEGPSSSGWPLRLDALGPDCRNYDDGLCLAEHPDLVITAGPQIRDVLAGELDAPTAVVTGAVHLEGDAALLDRFAETLRVPYSVHAPA